MHAFITAVLGLPAVAAAVIVIVLETYRPGTPDPPLFADAAPSLFAEAIMLRAGLEPAFEFIRAGVDPNEPLRVSDARYTAGRTIDVSPLMLAIAADDDDVVLMLLSAGADLDLPQNRLAGCFAQALGSARIVEIMAYTRRADRPSPCPEPRADAPTPLLAWSNAE